MQMMSKQLKTSRRAHSQSASAGPEGIAIASSHTRLPERLKAGIESLSGFSLDDVRVHPNSSKPEQLNAFAYAQGSDIHLAPGQERYLPHEAWHIVQQRQGRVKPTTSVAATPVNDSPTLEHEADQMGTKAIKIDAHQPKERRSSSIPNQQNTFAANRAGNAPAQLGKNQRNKNYYKNKHYKFNYRKKHDLYNFHIDSLIDGLDSDRRDLEKFELLKSRGTATYRKKLVTTFINKSKRDITEKIGELNATQYMTKKYPTSKMLLGFKKGTGLDQVYEDGNRIIVVEAKGPGAKLGTSDRKGKQMSIPWILETAKGMKDRALAGRIEKAHKKKRLVRLVITSTPGGHAPKNVDEF